MGTNLSYKFKLAIINSTIVYSYIVIRIKNTIVCIYKYTNLIILYNFSYLYPKIRLFYLNYF